MISQLLFIRYKPLSAAEIPRKTQKYGAFDTTKGSGFADNAVREAGRSKYF